MTTIYKTMPDGRFLNYFETRVSTTRKEMLRDSSRWAKKTASTIEPDTGGGTAGLVVPTKSLEFSVEGDRRWFSNHFATLFLNEEDLFYEVISHECLHVALAHERFVTRFKMDYLESADMEDDERLCYLHGRIFQSVMNFLQEKGHWKRRKR